MAFKTLLLMPYDDEGRKMVDEPYTPEWEVVKVDGATISIDISREFSYAYAVPSFDLGLIGMDPFGQKLVIDGSVRTGWDDQLDWRKFDKIGRYCVQQIKDPRKAQMAFSQAVILNPNSGALRYNLGLAYCERGLYARAIEHLSIGVKLSPRDPDMQFMLGEAMIRQGIKLKQAGASLPDASFGKELVYDSIWNQSGVDERDEIFSKGYTRQRPASELVLSPLRRTRLMKKEFSK
jgi:hypothetical protein